MFSFELFFSLFFSFTEVIQNGGTVARKSMKERLPEKDTPVFLTFQFLFFSFAEIQYFTPQISVKP